MTKEPTNTEKKHHTDLALAYLYENRKGEPMSLREISYFTGMNIKNLEEIYASAIKKLRKNGELIKKGLI